MESLSIPADPLGNIQNRAFGIEFHKGRDQQQYGTDKDQRKQGKNKVKTAL